MRLALDYFSDSVDSGRKKPCINIFGEGYHQTKQYCGDAAICCALAASKLIVRLFHRCEAWIKLYLLLQESAENSHNLLKSNRKVLCSSSFKLITLDRGWTIYRCSTQCSPILAHTHLVQWDQSGTPEACFRMNGDYEPEVRILEKRAHIQDVYAQVRLDYPSLPPLRDFQVASTPSISLTNHNMVNFRRTL